MFGCERWYQTMPYRCGKVSLWWSLLCNIHGVPGVLPLEFLFLTILNSERCRSNTVYTVHYILYNEFRCFISQLLKTIFTWDFKVGLIDYQSCFIQNFKSLAVQEPIFLKSKFGQNRALTLFKMYYRPGKCFFTLLGFDFGVM